MNILVIGSGGREHALCWAIKKSPLCRKLFCAPGNAGITDVAACLPVAVDDITGILNLCRAQDISFVVIGPELPLTLGLADALREAGVPCFGPAKAAAALEGSKGFMKDICAAANIPTAAYRRFTDAAAAKSYVLMQGAPIVVKADGLAAGKGVTVARTIIEAVDAIDDAMVKKVFGESGAEVVIEEFMEGEEVSFFAICDGETALPFAAAQDHKAAYDGDTGPNTGGMGAYSPAPAFDAAMQERVMREIIQPAITAMKNRGMPFTGVLFAGLMLTKDGPRLIEFNVRFGDPETEAMLPRLKTDLLALLYAAGKGMLDGVAITFHDQAVVSVVMAAKGYPGAYTKNTVIQGLSDAATMANTVIFHAGTARNQAGEVIATGGRVLAVTGWGATIEDAQQRAYQAVEKIHWPEGFCRKDIAWRAVGAMKKAG